MDIELLRNFCLKKKGVSEDFPFDENTLVFRVGSKMFCLTDLEKPFSINLKCEPEKAINLREEFEEITPGFHMNKKHWNTVSIIGSLPDSLIKEMIDDSYELVKQKLNKREMREMGFDN